MSGARVSSTDSNVVRCWLQRKTKPHVYHPVQSCRPCGAAVAAPRPRPISLLPPKKKRLRSPLFAKSHKRQRSNQSFLRCTQFSNSCFVLISIIGSFGLRAGADAPCPVILRFLYHQIPCIGCKCYTIYRIYRNRICFGTYNLCPVVVVSHQILS